ncbi:MAG: peptidylprolyl isomerase, partial [Gammaproteobacteria bacterium]|nr:peptidylprolyl isomerase [Gammaproteobacteria bacterium]
MFKNKSLGIICLVLASASAAADELSDKGQFLDGIAAVVNEGVVLKSQLNDQIEAITLRANREGMQLPPREIIEEQVLEQLIVEEIQMQRANRIGIQISDQMLNQTMARLAAQNNIAFEQLPQVLAAEGIDYGVYRREIRKQLTLDQLRQIDVIGRISVAPREIEACVADLEDNVVVNSEYNLSHILISVSEGATADEFAAAEQEANEVYEQLVAGSDFAEMAVRHSDSQTNLEGGALGWRKGDQLPTLFAEVVAPLESGQFSRPVRAVSGFHIVKINEMRGAIQRSQVNQMKVRHILVTPTEIIDDETAKQKVEDAREQIVEGGDFAEIAKLVSDDPGSANDG